jgi:hypothetical protein
MRSSRFASLLTLTVGLALWTLAPYGGCSCYNPLDSTAGGPTPTAVPPNSPLITNWETPGPSNNYLSNQWGGTAVTSVDAFGSTLLPGLAAGSTLAGGTSGHSYGMSGVIVKDGPPNYPTAEFSVTLGGIQDMLVKYGSFQGLQFSYMWSGTIPVGASFYVVARTSTVSDYGYWRYQIYPTDNAWHILQVYFPNKAGAPKFAQPTWAVAEPWATGTTPSGTKLVQFDFQIQPVTGVSSAYNVVVDDLSFF